MTWRLFLDHKETFIFISSTPQPLRFESLSLRTPQTVPPTQGTALQHKIESKLEKSLVDQFNIQLQHQMVVFQASMQEAMKSLREEMQLMKKASEEEVDQTSTSTSKAGPSKQSVELSNLNNQPNPGTSNHSDGQQPMETGFCGSSLPPQVPSPNMAPNHRIIIPNTWNNLKGCVLLDSKNTRTKRNTKLGQNTSHSLHLQRGS